MRPTVPATLIMTIQSSPPTTTTGMICLSTTPTTQSSTPTTTTIRLSTLLQSSVSTPPYGMNTRLFSSPCNFLFFSICCFFVNLYLISMFFIFLFSASLPSSASSYYLYSFRFFQFIHTIFSTSFLLFFSSNDAS